MEMAEQLRLFLSDEPLTIRRPSIWTQIGKKVYRHRKATFVWVMGFILMLVATTAVLFTQYRRANAMRAAARAALAQMSGRIEKLLDRAPADYETAHDTAETALRLIENTMRADPAAREDPELRYHLACLSFNFARSLYDHRRRDHFDAILAQYDRAIGILRWLVRDYPLHVKSVCHRYDLARALRSRGTAYFEMDAPDKNRLRAQATEEALAIVESITREFPAKLDWADARANYQISLAESYVALGRFDEALRLCRVAEESTSRLALAHPKDPRLPRNIELALLQRGAVLRKLNRLQEAEQAIRGGLDKAQLVEQLDSSNSTYRAEVVASLHQIAGFLLNGGRPAEAEPFAQEALERADALATEFPENDELLFAPLHVLDSLARAQYEGGNRAAAESTYRRAITRLEPLVLRRPDLSTARILLTELYEHCPINALRNPARARELNTKGGAR
jgi:tetratricopeptide (TPR) repeat protein